jgi:hypothetical protein
VNQEAANTTPRRVGVIGAAAIGIGVAHDQRDHLDPPTAGCDPLDHPRAVSTPQVPATSLGVVLERISQ